MALHWLVATLIIGAFALGWFMTDIPGFSPAKLRYYAWHKWLGCTVLILALVRLVWRRFHESPSFPPHMTLWQRRAAGAAHAALYLLMLGIPVAGYLYSAAANVPVVYLGLFPLPRIIDPDPVLKPIFRAAHVYLNYSLAVLVVAHVLAAFKHQFVDKDSLLSRMLPLNK